MLVFGLVFLVGIILVSQSQYVKIEAVTSSALPIWAGMFFYLLAYVSLTALFSVNFFPAFRSLAFGLTILMTFDCYRFQKLRPILVRRKHYTLGGSTQCLLRISHSHLSMVWVSDHADKDEKYESDRNSKRVEIVRNLQAVSELTLDIPEGALCGLIGPNGAGKQRSSVCSLVFSAKLRDNAGARKPLIYGKPPVNKIAMLPQDSTLPRRQTARKVLELLAGGGNKDEAHQKAKRALEMVGLGQTNQNKRSANCHTDNDGE